MPQTFLFEELDDATRDYLIAVRAAEGSATPGMFAATSSALAGCGCIAGPIIIIATLCLTLTNWINVIYDDPVRVALAADRPVCSSAAGSSSRPFAPKAVKGAARSPATGCMPIPSTSTKPTASR